MEALWKLKVNQNIMKSKKQLKSYKFYFQQVNQEVYDQKAYSYNAAYRKAKKEWRKNNSHPIMLDAEILESNVWKTLLLK